MKYKLIDYAGKGFIVMGAHDFQRWQDNLERRFDDSAEAGNVHLHVRVEGQERRFSSVEEYLKEFSVRDVTEEDAKVLGKVFAVNHKSHHAWYGAHDIFQPFAGQ